MPFDYIVVWSGFASATCTYSVHIFVVWFWCGNCCTREILSLTRVHTYTRQRCKIYCESYYSQLGMTEKACRNVRAFGPVSASSRPKTKCLIHILNSFYLFFILIIFVRAFASHLVNEIRRDQRRMRSLFGHSMLVQYHDSMWRKSYLFHRKWLSTVGECSASEINIGTSFQPMRLDLAEWGNEAW